MRNNDEKNTCGALHDLLPFVQLLKRENQPWRSLKQVAG